MPATLERASSYFAIPIRGLIAEEALPFPLYLELGDAGSPVLYCERGVVFDRSRLNSLMESGVTRLLVPASDRRRYHTRIESELDRIVRDARIPVDARAELLHGSATALCREIFVSGRPDAQSIERAERVAHAGALLLVKDNSSRIAIRRVLGAAKELAEHSVNVSLLSQLLAGQQGLAPDRVAEIGLAGLLHDLGRVSFDEEDRASEDPAHCMRGARLLEELGLSPAVISVARQHHERMDGGGYPDGIAGEAIPLPVQLVGLVDVFEQVYSSHGGRLSVFDCIRIIAQAYRGCFEEEIVRSFVTMFRG